MRKAAAKSSFCIDSLTRALYLKRIPAHGRRSGTRCRGKATVHTATGRAITRASACDVRTAQQTRAPRAGSSSSKPAATRCLLAPDVPAQPPAPCRVLRQIPGPIMDMTAAPAGGAHAGCGCAGATPPTAALDVRARAHEPSAVQPHFRPRSTPSSASGRPQLYTATPRARGWRRSCSWGCAGAALAHSGGTLT